jgi:hypothetical protein
MAAAFVRGFLDRRVGVLLDRRVGGLCDRRLVGLLDGVQSS